MTIMMDLNKIRTLKPLEAIQRVLKEFVTFDKSTILSVYTGDLGWDEDDYEADLEKATYMLEQVEKRMKSLGHHLAKGKNVSQSPSHPAATEQLSSVV